MSRFALRSLFLGFFFAFFATVALAAEPGPEGAPPDELAAVEGFSRFLTFYYQHPQPERIGEFLVAAQKLGLLDDMQTVFPVFGFLAGVFHDNPGRLTAWTATIAPDDARLGGAVLLGLRHAGTPEATQEGEVLLMHMPQLEPLIAKYPSQPLTELPLDHPGLLDALWGNFFATGSAAPVERIMTALPWADRPSPQKPTQENTRQLLIGNAARWSLVSNAYQHPRVLEICENALKNQRDSKIKKALAAVIKEAKAKRAGGH
jgi:hypothetical protein